MRRFGRRGRLAVLLVGVLALSALAGCGDDDDADTASRDRPTATTVAATSDSDVERLPERTTVKVGSTSFNVYAYWDLLVADQEGFFDKRNIDVEMIQLSPQANLIAAGSAGDVDFVANNFDSIVLAADTGAPLKFVVAQSYSAYAVVGKPPLQGLSDLRGKKIAVTDPNAGSTLILLAMLEEEAGLGRDDVSLVPIAGGTGDRYSAMAGGAVDATIVAPPFDAQAEADGSRVLGRDKDTIGKIPLAGMAVNTSYAQDNPDVVRAFVQALAEAQEFLHDESNRDASIAALVGQGVDEALAAATYDNLVAVEDSVIATGGKYDDDAAVQKVLDGLPGRDGKPRLLVSKFFDWSYLE